MKKFLSLLSLVMIMYHASVAQKAIDAKGTIIHIDSSKWQLSGSFIYTKNPSWNIGIGTASPAAQLHTTGTVRFAGLGTSSINNTILTADGSGNLATRTLTDLLNGSAITSLNGLSTSTQTFATGTAGSDFAITSSGGTHTFNLPSAGATARGLLKSADWTIFNNKIGSVSATTPAAATTTSGAVTIVNTGAYWNANQLQGRDIATTVPLADQVLVYNGTTNKWTPGAAAPAVTTNALSSSANIMTSNVNGVSVSTPIINTTVATNPTVNTIGTTINGVAATSNATIINNNALTLTGSSLTSTVNGIGSAAATLSALPIAGDVSGTLAAATVGKLQGTAVSATAPTANQVLIFNGTAWAPGTAAPATTIHTMSSSANTLTSVVNGVTATAPTVNSVANNSSVNILSTSVNGVVGTAVNIINSNALTQNGSNQLVSTVNGVAADALTVGMTGDVTGTLGATAIAANAVTTAKIANSNITYAKLQNVSAARLLGNAGGTAAAPSEISLGSGLSFNAGVLNTTASGTVTNVTGTAPISVASGATAPVISIATASAGTSGALSSADWSTFNSKQSALTFATGLTNTGGTVTLNPATATTLGGVKAGSGINVAADGTISAANGGTVTSVSATVPTGLSIAVTNPGTTPAIAITTTLSGPVRGNGTGFTTGSTNLASEVTGVLPVANGGTGSSSAAATGALLVGNGTAFAPLAPGAAGTVLTSAGTSSAPAWAAPANIYNTDGTLGGPRIVTQGANDLTFNATTGDLIFNPSGSGNMGVGTATPALSAVLEVASTSRGMLVPRMTTAQRTGISGPVNGLLVYDITTNSFWVYKNTLWVQIAAVPSLNPNAPTVGAPITAAAYTLQASDNGAILEFNTTTGTTVTVPTGLPAGFMVSVTQLGTGAVTFSAATGMTLRNAYNFTKTAAQWSKAGLEISSTTSNAILSGDLQ